jgi:hypothetical protein
VATQGNAPIMQAMARKISGGDDFFFISILKYFLEMNHMFDASI